MEFCNIVFQIHLMATNYSTLHRYLLTIEKMRRIQNCSLKELAAHLSLHDLGVSERTIARDIEQMRHEFGLDIQYNAKTKGYSFKASDDKEVEAFLNFIQLVQVAGITVSGKQNIKDLASMVQFDTNHQMAGIEFLKDLLFAIKNKRYIHFNHQNYHTETLKKHTIKPYLLKQYQSRWYVVGEIESNEYRTFGCDRISQLEIDTKSYKGNQSKIIRHNFEKIIGLKYSNGEVQKVELQFTALQAKYIKAAPLHASQYVLEENNKYTVIALHVIPNYELVQKILMLGDQVKVLSPLDLKKDVKAILKHSLSLYVD